MAPCGCSGACAAALWNIPGAVGLLPRMVAWSLQIDQVGRTCAPCGAAPAQCRRFPHGCPHRVATHSPVQAGHPVLRVPGEGHKVHSHVPATAAEPAVSVVQRLVPWLKCSGLPGTGGTLAVAGVVVDEYVVIKEKEFCGQFWGR